MDILCGLTIILELSGDVKHSLVMIVKLRNIPSNIKMTTENIIMNFFNDVFVNNIALLK